MISKSRCLGVGTSSSLLFFSSLFISQLHLVHLKTSVKFALKTHQFAVSSGMHSNSFDNVYPSGVGRRTREGCGSALGTYLPMYMCLV
ncbi:hypothetical protein F4818DRAFT_404161, partial [Hypoxylon cercidicola]